VEVTWLDKGCTILIFLSRTSPPLRSTRGESIGPKQKGPLPRSVPRPLSVVGGSGVDISWALLCTERGNDIKIEAEKLVNEPI
jgi:hypothetical protein